MLKVLLPYALGLAAIVFGLRLLADGLELMLRRFRISRSRGPRDITPRDLELLTRDLLRAMGYKARWTEFQNDGGVDVVAVGPDGEKIVVQCKRWLRRRVGVKPVRELIGVVAIRGADEGWLISTSDFTDQARREAKGQPVRLINGRQLFRFLREHGLAQNWDLI